MPAQLLVNVLTVTNLAGGATVTLAHGLASNDVSVVPTLIFPDRPTTIAVQSANATTVTFINNGGALPRNVKTQQTLNGGAGAIQMTQTPTNTP